MNKEEICYTIDASRMKGKPLNIFYPTTKEEIQKIIRGHESIVPRGSGTTFVGGAHADNAALIEMRGLNKLISVDTTKKIVQVEAGITLKELNERLKQMRMEFPICFNEQSTIGSMIAVNCIGEKSMRYGAMKDWVEKIEFVDGKGGLISAGKADLAEACGMEGTTGVIVNASLKYVPLIEPTASILQSDNLDEIIATARRLKADPEVIMLKFYSKKVSTLIGFPEKYHVIVFFNSGRGKIQGEGLHTLIDMIKKEYYYLHKNNYYQSEDVKLFFDKIKEYALSLEGLSVPFIGDLGMGIINSFFTDSEIEKVKTVINLNIKSGGKKGRYPIGIKRKYLLDDLEKKIFLRIKKRHDPIGKMNKGKLFDYVPEIPQEEIKKIDREGTTEEKKETVAVDKFIAVKTEIKPEQENLVAESNIQSEVKSVFAEANNNNNNNNLLGGKDFEKPAERKTSPAELEAIRNIMFNRRAAGEPSGKITVADNLERKPSSQTNKREQDLINSIMNNTIKKPEKKEEKK
ncbi:MAG: hypothetical protein RL557_625 [archaeon]|jgi:hypothetical protein